MSSYCALCSRLDKDQAVRKLAQQDLGKKDENYYEFEGTV